MIIHLPNNYHYQDFLAYHLRDKQSVAEIVVNTQLRKEITWYGQAAKLTFILNKNSVSLALHIDNPYPLINQEELEKLDKNMLGLYQKIEPFEDKYYNHPVIGKLISRQRGLRIYQAAIAFEAISWAIIGQQISGAAGYCYSPPIHSGFW